MSKIFNTQQWRIICDTGEDQTNHSGITIKARRKNKTVSFQATLDADPNRIYVDVAVDELAVAGNYYIWPVTLLNSKLAAGEPQRVVIYEEGL